MKDYNDFFNRLFKIGEVLIILSCLYIGAERFLPEFNNYILFIQALIVLVFIHVVRIVLFSKKNYRNVEYKNTLTDLIKDDRIIKILKEAWRCYEVEAYQAGSVMLRKALESSLHSVLSIKEGNDNDLCDSTDRQPYSLKRKINIITTEKGLLSNFLRSDIIHHTKFFGDLGAHDRFASINEDDFKKANSSLEKTLEHMFNKIKNNI